MADPISILAVAGLVYAGRALSTESNPEESVPKEEIIEAPSEPTLSDEVPKFNETQFAPRTEIPQKKEMASFSDVAPMPRSGGQEVLNMRERMYDQGKMNNLAPIEKQLIGPGLGNPDAPATGGFQQLFRVNPTLVGAHKLTHLPGRITGPGHDVSGGLRSATPTVGHNMPEKTAFLPDRLPNAGGHAQGMSGARTRPSHQRTMRTTNRSETGLRTDGLGYAPAKRVVSGLTNSQDITRLKNDENTQQFYYNNQPAPSISNFYNGHNVAPATNLALENKRGFGYTPEQLQRYGFRADDRRGNPNRPANAGRMNVREAPLKATGLVTSVRADTSRIDGREGVMSGGWTQQYNQVPYHNFNAYKDAPNPYASSGASGLDVAKEQLKNNPIAQKLYK